MQKVGRFTPLVTILLLANIVLWFVPYLAGFLRPLQISAGFIPARLEIEAAAFLPPSARSVVWMVPFFLTPLTSAFIHASMWHLLFNMMILVLLGAFMEHPLGSVRFGLLYLAGAYAAALAQFLWDPNSVIPMIGASGAISAVMAVYFLYYARRRPGDLGPIPARYVHMIWLVLVWSALNLLVYFAVSDGVAAFAHIGGFLAGIALAIPLARSAGLARAE